ncbi:MAG: sulfur relay protein TusB/DsrH [Candidatus Azotimanducaceae bacterium]|jgi:sulfur relay protein TusB/DsrH
MILHTINKTSALAKCRDLVATGDQVVLLEDGVNLGLETLPFDVYVMAGDAEARGLSGKLGKTKLITYVDLVEMTAAADKVCAWF